MTDRPSSPARLSRRAYAPARRGDWIFLLRSVNSGASSMTQLRLSLLAVFAFALLAGCKPKDIPATGLTNPDGTTSLADARKGFTTKLARQEKSGEPVDEPPANVFRKVQYDAPVGKCAAYLAPDPKDGKK